LAKKTGKKNSHYSLGRGGGDGQEAACQDKGATSATKEKSLSTAESRQRVEDIKFYRDCQPGLPGGDISLSRNTKRVEIMMRSQQNMGVDLPGMGIWTLGGEVLLRSEKKRSPLRYCSFTGAKGGTLSLQPTGDVSWEKG